MRALFFGLLVAALASAALPAGAQTPPVSIKQVSDADGALTVVVSVLDAAGRPVPGLNAGQFAVALDGTPAAVQGAAYATDPSNGVCVVLALDASGSMAGARLAQAKDASATFLDSLQPADQVALLAFNTEVAFLSDFTADREAVKRLVQGLAAAGNTALFDATDAALRKAASCSLPRKAVVLVTDGENVNPRPGVNRDGAIGAARAAGIPIYAIGLGAEADRPYLNELAAVSSGLAQHAPTGATLAQLYAAIADALRGQYVLRAQPQPVKRAPEHTLRVTVNLPAGPASAEVAFPGTGLTLQPDPTPAPTPSPAPTPAPTEAPAPTVEPVVAPAEEGSSGINLLPIVLVGAAVAALAGFWFLRRRQAEERDPVPAVPPGPVAAAEPTPAPQPEGAPRAVASATIVVAAGPLAGERVIVSAEPLTIGTSEECSLVLPVNGRDAEPQHARIWQRDGRFMLHRLARSSPLLLDGSPIQWAVLEPGDRFSIGHHTFEFEQNAGTNGA